MFDQAGSKLKRAGPVQNETMQAGLDDMLALRAGATRRSTVPDFFKLLSAYSLVAALLLPSAAFPTPRLGQTWPCGVPLAGGWEAP